MKVIKWTTEDDYGLEYFDNPVPNSNEAIAAIIESLQKNGYKFDGYYHQNGNYGCPMLDDGTICHYSFRAWGAIMAKAYPKENDDSYAYLRWAWDNDEEPIFPNKDTYVHGVLRNAKNRNW